MSYNFRNYERIFVSAPVSLGIIPLNGRIVAKIKCRLYPRQTTIDDTDEYKSRQVRLVLTFF